MVYNYPLRLKICYLNFVNAFGLKKGIQKKVGKRRCFIFIYYIHCIIWLMVYMQFACLIPKKILYKSLIDKILLYFRDSQMSQNDSHAGSGMN